MLKNTRPAPVTPLSTDKLTSKYWNSCTNWNLFINNDSGREVHTTYVSVAFYIEIHSRTYDALPMLCQCFISMVACISMMEHSKKLHYFTGNSYKGRKKKRHGLFPSTSHYYP